MPEETPNPALITLLAPVSGPMVPIEDVPDPVFAQKMLGNGVSIDPVDQRLVSPCNGKILHVNHAGHAVTVVTPEGVKILMHLGLDTVALKGKGFTSKVLAGQDVSTGETLIEFDADFLAINAKSLLTQIVIANGDSVTDFSRCSGVVRAGVDPVMSFRVIKSLEISGDGLGKWIKSPEVPLPNPSGLHARPAAVLANMAKRFKSEIVLVKGIQKANARSVVAIKIGRASCRERV